MRRHLNFASLLGLVLAAVVSNNAFAHFQIPATAGTARNMNRMNERFWSIESDGYVHRVNSTTVTWLIPLPFHAIPAPNQWTASVMVSKGTKCSLQWRADALPDPVGEGTTVAEALTDGRLYLTSDPTAVPPTDLCPVAGPAAGCITSFSTAFVTCDVLPNGYVGAVTYTIDLVVTPAPP